MLPSPRSVDGVRAALLHLDAGRLDDRPPLLDLGLVEGGERLRRQLLARGRSPARGRRASGAIAGVGQRCLTDRVVELGDDLLRRALGRPQGVPEGEIEAGQPGLVGGRNIRRGTAKRLLAVTA